MAARIKCRRDEPVGRHFRLGSGADQAYWPTAEYPQADSFQYTGGNDSRSLPTIATPLGICRLLRAHVHLPGHRLCASRVMAATGIICASAGNLHPLTSSSDNANGIDVGSFA